MHKTELIILNLNMEYFRTKKYAYMLFFPTKKYAYKHISVDIIADFRYPHTRTMTSDLYARNPQ